MITRFSPLVSFWQVCKEDSKGLCGELYKDVGGVTKEKFLEYRNRIIGERDLLTQAQLYFTINRCSFSGATLSGGFSEEASQKRMTKSSIERVEKIDLR